MRSFFSPLLPFYALLLCIPGYILYISEAVSLADYQLDLVIRCFNPGIAQAKPDGVQDMFLVTLDLFIQIMEHWDPAVTCPPEPVIQIRFGFVHISVLEDHTERFLQKVATI